MRAGGDRRGNTVDRKRRKLWLLATAAASIPWEGFARASSDGPCRICRPEVPEPESEDK